MRKRTIVVAAGLVAAVVVGARRCRLGARARPTLATIGGGASIAPANAAAFVAIDSDVSSDAVESRRRPPRPVAVLRRGRQRGCARSSSSERSSAGTTTSSRRSAPSSTSSRFPGTKPRLVGLTHGGDQAKLDALLGKAGHGIVSKQIDGWTAFAQTQAALDRVTHATTKLAGDATYQAAAAKLADDALVRAYANGADAPAALLASRHGRAQPCPPSRSSGPPPTSWLGPTACRSTATRRTARAQRGSRSRPRRSHRVSSTRSRQARCSSPTSR